MSNDATDAADQPFLVAERTGHRTYLGRNERGAQVRIGPEGEEGVFSPGELLAIAVAGCTGMSADSRISSERGDDVGISVGVSRTKLEGENRYERLTVELLVHAPADGSQPDPARTERMIATAVKAVASLCTVSRTVEAGAEINLVITAEEPA